MRMSKLTEDLVGQPMFALKQKIRNIQGIIHLEIGDTFWDAPENVLRATKDSLNHDGSHYTDSTGIPQFKEEILKDTYREYGMNVLMSQIVVMPANAAIDYVIRCTCDVGDEVIVPDPCFPTYTSVLSYLGIKAVPIPLKVEDGFKLRAESVISAITGKTKLIILNSPSNPTGAMMDKEDVVKIYEAANDRGIWILSDEVYSRIIYEGNHHSACFIDKCRESTILLKSFSKCHFMPGFRLGYIIAPEELAEKIGILFQTIYSCMPKFVQFGGIAALKNYKYPGFLSYMKDCRDLVVERLNSIKGVSCITPEGAFYAYADITGTGMTSKHFADYMIDEAKVAVLPGDCFGASGEGFIRLCYATKKEILSKALLKMEEALANVN